MAALQRQQSATSLVKLLRDPLGYLWRYGFGWNEPKETEAPLLLDALAFGNLLHDALRAAVTRLEDTVPGGFASAAPQQIRDTLGSALDEVAAEWELSQPTPPPVIWRRKLQDIHDLAFVALTHGGIAQWQSSRLLTGRPRVRFPVPLPIWPMSYSGNTPPS
jgi:hypothetical protein